MTKQIARLARHLSRTARRWIVITAEHTCMTIRRTQAKGSSTRN